jgi:hypothetical protein
MVEEVPHKRPTAREIKGHMEDGMFYTYNVYIKGILSTKIVIFSYPKLMSFSVLTFIK